MAKYQIADQQAFMSLTAETAINTPKLLTAEHVGIRLNPSVPPLPELQRIPDQMIGDGTERSSKLRKGWWIPRQIPIAGVLNTETAARLGNRCLGGTRSSTVITVGASFDVTTHCQTKAQGRIPKLTTLGFDLGGYDVIWPSMAVTSYEIAFDAENNCTFNANLINTGWHRRNKTTAALTTAGLPAGLAAALSNPVPIVPPAPPEHHFMHPAATRVTFSNGTTIDFAVEGELLGGSCSLNNNVVVRQLPGDPFLEAGVKKSGAYARDIHRGTREPMARLKVSMDETLQIWTIAQAGTDITSLTFLFVSEDKIGATPEDYEFEWKFPLAEFEAVAIDTDGDDVAVSMSFYPKTDVVTGGYVIQRIRTGNTDLQ